MSIIVKKFGGTSVGDVDRIKRVARRVKQTVKEGHKVVVVVSARSGVTNELIARAKAIQKAPSDREMDVLMTCGEQETIALLCMALDSLDVPAVSRTGWQAGIITEGLHGKARIREVTGGDIRKQLRAGNVVVIAGFQGVNDKGDVTTFGRGGSDLSAIAMAGALKAKTCQIFTDVEGVFTADPRIVPNACKIDAINYEEMLELASSGSKVMQTRAVEFAQKHNIPTTVQIIGQAMTTDTASTFNEQSMIKLVGSDMSKAAAQKVYDQAGIDPADIDVCELHDCFAPNELITYEALGFCPEGEGQAFVEDGDNTYGGKIVTNPSGGLLSKGHPLGATGLAQCYELTHQLRGTADMRQVSGARIALQHNLGLGGACVVTAYERTAL